MHKIPDSDFHPVHTERITLRWGDMDALGHVNNTEYFRFMEQARVGYFDTIVPQAERWKTLGMVIAHADCTFKVPLTYPGVVLVRVLIAPPGGSSLRTRYEIRVEGEETLYAVGEATMVFVDMARQKPMRIPADVRERLSAPRS